MKTWKVNFAVLLCAALMSLSAGADAGTRGQTTDSAAVSTFVWPRLRIGIDFGGGYGIGKTDSKLTSDLKAHANRLRIGAIAGADVSWFFMKGLGAGIKGKLMYSSSSVDMGDDLRSCSHIDLTVGLRFNFGCRKKQ